MRYRVHKHCRRPECFAWAVSTTAHVQIHETDSWRDALDWTLARVTREALTRRDGPGWVDQEKWRRAIMTPLTWEQITDTNAYKERMARWRTAVENGDLFINCAGRTMQVVPFEPTKLDTAPNPLFHHTTYSGLSVDESLSEGFADLVERAQMVWPQPRFHEADPLVNAQVAGYVGEFATDESPEPANSGENERFWDRPAPAAMMFADAKIAENPKIVDSQQISDSGA